MRLIYFALTFMVLFSCGQSKGDQTKISTRKDTVPEIKDSIFTLDCLHKDLSNTFDLEAKITKYHDISENHDSSIVLIKILNKKTKVLLDSISYASLLFYQGNFENCLNTRSYTTGKDTSRQIVDNDFGDVIVADLNFDNLEDIAVVNDMGGNGGMFYSYYLQTRNGKFILDHFLTDSMVYFPWRINNSKMTLMTTVHAGVCGYREHTYKFERGSNTWKQIRNELKGLCE